MSDQKFDVVWVRYWIADRLQERGFTPRDADPSDFQKDDDSRIRFKLGTSYQEVTVQVWHEKTHTTNIRILGMKGLDDLLRSIDGFIAQATASVATKNGQLPGDWHRADEV